MYSNSQHINICENVMHSKCYYNFELKYYIKLFALDVTSRSELITTKHLVCEFTSLFKHKNMTIFSSVNWKRKQNLQINPL